jgi:hypothetical protein
VIHPDTELRFINRAIGYGIFATKLIPKGTVVWTMCGLDRQYTPQQAAEIDPIHYHHLLEYSYVDAVGNLIFCWDHGRYLNHSCNPTNIDLGSADISMARRDILPGEQITCDYGLFNILVDLECHCGVADCRGVIRGDDLLVYGDLLQAQTQEVLPFAAQVKQFLYPFIREKEKFTAYMNGTIPLPSHKNFFCPTDIKNKLRKIFNLERSQVISGHSREKLKLTGVLSE